jgi:hypothetical protein
MLAGFMPVQIWKYLFLYFNMKTDNIFLG